MTPSPTERPILIDQTPLTAAHLDAITEALSTLIGLMAPLHQLLEAQASLEGGVTARLEGMLQTLSSISGNLQTSAEALTRLAGSETISPALEARLDTLMVRQQGMGTRMIRIEQDLRRLLDWIGTPLLGEAVPNS